MQLPLTHRYSAKTFDDLVPEIVPVLQSFIRVDAFHVLITGGTSTGKTSTCNVLFNEYYGSDTSRIMVLGGLKEQGMTFYRNEVKCFCQTTMHGKKKTLMVKDVDEFPEPAQQVLLHYLDHYRSQVNFIMTARNETSVIQALHSRLVRIHLNPMSTDFVASIVRKVSSDTQMAVAEPEIQLIAKRSAHSVTAAINCLEKLGLTNSPINAEAVEAVFGLIHPHKLDKFVEMVEAGEQNDAAKYLCTFIESGFSVVDLLDALFAYLKGSTLPDERKYHYVQAVCKYTAIFHIMHEHPIEIAFFVNDLCSGRT